MILMKEIIVNSRKKNDMIEITSDVNNIIKESKVQNGFVIVYVPHTTAGITINEGADPSVQRDIIETLKNIIPENSDYHHMEGNSDAHIKASLIGSSITVLIKNKKLVLGTWQSIFFFEGDGPRNRKVYLEIIEK
jgi:secondary thiamine-phosphate synthase enzyme